MALPKFNLNKRKGRTGPTDIIMSFYINGKRLRYSTGVSVEEKYFNPKCNSGNAKPIKSTAPYAEQLNDKLINISNSAMAIASQATGEDLTPSFVKGKLDEIFKLSLITEESPKSEDFILFFEKLYHDTMTGKRLISEGKNKGRPYSFNMVKNYGNALSAIKRYMKYKGISSLYYPDINKSFYESFRDFLFTQENKEISTFSSYIKEIRTAMSETGYEGFNKKHFYLINSESDTLALSLEQVDLIHNLDLSDSTKYIILPNINRYGVKINERIYYSTLDSVRDLFLIGCYSAMRFQNYSTLKIDEVEDSFIRIKQIKTGSRVTIPIMSRLRKVLDKYNGSLPSTFSNQQFNRLIKEVGRLAGLTNLVQVRKTSGNKVVYVEEPLYSRISSHTARRTYATIMFKAGVPPLLIMGATGHKTEKSFLRYIRATNEDKAHLLADYIKKLGL